MARIFNIYFTYEEVLHSAIVSVHTTPLFTEYTLGNLDTDLRLRLPGDKIIRGEDNELHFQRNTSADDQGLISAILRSLAKHLQGNEASF